MAPLSRGVGRWAERGGKGGCCTACIRHLMQRVRRARRLAADVAAASLGPGNDDDDDDGSGSGSEGGGAESGADTAGTGGGPEAAGSEGCAAGPEVGERYSRTNFAYGSTPLASWLKASASGFRAGLTVRYGGMEGTRGGARRPGRPALELGPSSCLATAIEELKVPATWPSTPSWTRTRSPSLASGCRSKDRSRKALGTGTRLPTSRPAPGTGPQLGAPLPAAACSCWGCAPRASGAAGASPGPAATATAT
jgi:hypothetical protein